MDSCAKCGKPTIPQLKFCAGCGAPRAAQLAAPPPAPAASTCGSCSKPLEPGQRFCGHCGAARDGAAAAPAPGSVPTQYRAPPLQVEEARQSPPPASMHTRQTQKTKSTASVLFVVPRHASEGDRGATLSATLSRFVGGPTGQVLFVEADTALEDVQAALRAANFDAVCIIGSAKDIPHSAVRDLAGHDEAIYTDNFFGMTYIPGEEDRYHGDVLPETPVSRIPSLNAALIERLLNVDDRLCDTWQGGVAVSAKVWRGASAAVLESLAGRDGPALQLSPPATIEDVDGLLCRNVGRLYFNVHGTDQAPVWVGDNGMGDYPTVLQPPTIAIAQDAIVISEACYGAMIVDGEPAISHTFLQRGAGAFVGSTIIAWGPANPPPSLADTIVTGTYRALDEGIPLGLALLEAKLEILNSHLDRDEVLSPSAHNTLLSFVAYGSPLACTNSRPKATSTAGRRFGARSAVESKTRGGGSVLDRVRGRMSGGGGDDADNGVLEQYRQRIRRRLPPGSWEVLDQGRTLLAGLSQRFRTYSEIKNQLTGLLGEEPASVSVVDYRSGNAKRTSINGSVTAGNLTKHAIVLVDEDGQLLDSMVSR